ncbi:MAG: hypothetical protein HUJ56_00535 [Erysipelotrichaceae bacterium]|nr:hypothetical protein [Erysipelotrichaceae bacterium]
MNFKISKRIFLNAINKVSLAISPNSPLPSLSGILIKVKSDRIILVGSNADLSIEKTLYATDEELNLEIMDQGEIVIESRYLSEIIRRFDEDIIQMEIVDGSLTRIKGGKIDYKINGFINGIVINAEGNQKIYYLAISDNYATDDVGMLIKIADYQS